MALTSRKKEKRSVPPTERKESHRVTRNGSSRTRQDKRNDRLFNKTQLIKKIEGHMRYLSNQKHNAPEEDNFIYRNQIQWFNRLKEVAKAADADDLLTFQSIYSEFNSKKNYDDEIKSLRKEIRHLKKELNREAAENENMRNENDENIDKLTSQIVKLTSDIELLRTNFKIVDAERNQNEIKMNDALAKRDDAERKYNIFMKQHENELRTRDERETALYSQIEILQNRVKDLESLFGVSTRNYRVVNNESSIYLSDRTDLYSRNTIVDDKDT
ncbi:1227_t:CDS:2 [Dentiscutata heterogama]|uniref:1227_t:CDS:1 n=1 Tax=Dentiscutata heterogama TaxID=1316150 RepID=A0ACA9JYE3_9GLOM|nr:1227_t:CDS:2 [Dentiscutata heterogama]